MKKRANKKDRFDRIEPVLVCTDIKARSTGALAFVFPWDSASPSLRFLVALVSASSFVTHPASPRSRELRFERIAFRLNTLRELNVLGTWAFGAVRFGECDLLSFTEVVVCYAFKAVGVKE